MCSPGRSGCEQFVQPIVAISPNVPTRANEPPFDIGEVVGYTHGMSQDLTCPICTMPEPLIRDDGYECGICGHEWLAEIGDDVEEVRDANGNLLATGDDVTVIKDLKLDGKTGGVKVGTKVKSIRLVPGDHPIDGKVNGRSILIKAEFVRKA